jgi:AraC-like DNA-binding protein
VGTRLSNIIGAYQDEGVTVQKIFGVIENRTKYNFTNEFNLKYVFMRLPIMSEKNIFFVGPYLSEPPSTKDVLEIGETLKLPLSTQKPLKEYYSSLPVISEGDRLFTVIDLFCEKIWQDPSFSTVEINGSDTLPITQFNLLPHGRTLDETVATMEMMETRYAFENELIQAVVLGQQHKEKELISVFNEQMFQKRIQDPLRNAKNYCIIMNTLLRKAAEQGGVHPMYIDRESSKLAAKIELINDVKNIPDLMREIFSSYCRLVRKHSTKKYSPIVKKTILTIDSDISAELSLSTLAEKQSISSGYLATVFKSETGKTVSEYIRERRISYALHLLNTTNLQIQTIAMHCGIMDVQYFSKIFKKQVGKTPKEYRDAIRQ